MKWFQYFLMIVLSVWLTACQTKVSPPCKNLGKVHNIDDWLYQVYSNIDSQCLFEMPVSELEQIWGLPVIDETLPNAFEDSNRKKDIQRMKVAETFYVLKKNDDNNLQQLSFEIEIADKYLKQHYWTFGGSFLEGVMPKLLPQFDFYYDPHVRMFIPFDDESRAFYENHPLIKNGSQYKSHRDYYWVNVSRHRSMPSLEIDVGYIPTANRIIFKNHTGDLYYYYYVFTMQKLAVYFNE